MGVGVDELTLWGSKQLTLTCFFQPFLPLLGRKCHLGPRLECVAAHPRRADPPRGDGWQHQLDFPASVAHQPLPRVLAIVPS